MLNVQLFLRFSAGYFLFAAVVLLLWQDNGYQALVSSLQGAPALLLFIWTIVGYVAGFLVLAAVLAGPRMLLSRLPALVLCLVAILFLHTGFLMFKTSMPSIVPYFADPFFARLDVAMHGADPWVWTHEVGGRWATVNLLPVYMAIWAAPALFLPMIVVALDKDEARSNRFAILYVVGWIVLGNAVALAGLSGGPVYYDRIEGGERFAELTRSLVDIGVAGSPIGALQETLWRLYDEGSPALGGGISAFPSVHVGAATVFGLYLVERSKWLIPVALAFVGTILFLSVFIGYHYAVDGYFSIALVMGVWLWLRRRDRASKTTL